eukprot:m.532731 g.532731  ORF g.532731 m.532731 type:complete len:200 (+) comp22048_c1_seq2:226-825(+)
MCLDGSPTKDDPHGTVGRQWETGMCYACCNNFCGCVVSCFLFPCCACHLRRKALQYDMSQYACCQRYVCYKGCVDCCGCCERNCPNLTLCFESLVCHCFAVSATRMYLQDERQIQTDPCDNRIIRLSNLCQLLACICQILACIIPGLENAARCMSLAANIMYCITCSCMQAQTHLELKMHPTPNDYGPVTQQPRGKRVA